MANTDLNIDVYANLTVSDDTCMRCARLIEMWMDDHPDAMLVCETVPYEDRIRHKLRIERLNPTEEQDAN